MGNGGCEGLEAEEGGRLEVGGEKDGAEGAQVKKQDSEAVVRRKGGGGREGDPGRDQEASEGARRVRDPPKETKGAGGSKRGRGIIDRDDQGRRRTRAVPEEKGVQG